MKFEKNVDIFNRDVQLQGRYEYTGTRHASAVIATRRQTDAINSILHRFFPKKISILDVGCGDGTFTWKLYQDNRIRHILGFDIAKKAIAQAKKKFVNNSSITFKLCSIYDARKKFGKIKFDVAIVRGVLHHVYYPQKAIQALSFVPFILVLEPNGYNPILKAIEKLSPYHRKHEERSYFPPTLNSWFEKNGYEVVMQEFVGIVPYFTTDRFARFLHAVEPVFEKIPFFHIFYAGSNVILYKKRSES